MAGQQRAKKAEDEKHATPPPARRRGRPPRATPDASEETLLQVAFDIFAERGYDGTTMRDLAERLGVSHGFFNARFGSKEELWYRSVRHYFAREVSTMNEVFDLPFPSEMARLKAIVRTVTELAAKRPGLPRLINAESRIDSPRLDFIHQQVIGPFATGLEKVLAGAGREQGRPPPDVITFSIYLVATVTCYFAEGPLIRRLGGTVPVTPDEIRRQADLTAGMLLGPLFDAS